MKPREPLPIYHSWPLFERDRHLALDRLLDRSVPALSTASCSPAEGRELARHGVGLWTCDLADDSLTWSAGVYDIFGLPRDAPVTRQDAVALYCDESREVMERLRAYAIRHRRGFTVDVEIRPSLIQRRWMRLIAVPVCEGRRVTALRGVKHVV